MRLRRLLSLCVATGLMAAAHVAAAAPIRSDVPLWPTGGDGDNVWPQAITSKDELGFTSIVAVGDWRLRYTDCDPKESGDDCYTWLRLEFFSLIDGGVTVTEARTRKGLDDAIGTPALFVTFPNLDRSDGAKVFALQIGFRGGSRYIVLKGRGQPLYKQFDILDGVCEGDGAAAWTSRGYRERRAPEHGFFLTDYCAVRTVKGLENLAIKGLAAKPEQAMEFVGSLDEAADKPSP